MTKHYDVAVIGAGLVGLASAYEIAKRGLKVIVFDQGEINRGASGRNAGSLHFQIEPRMVADLPRAPGRLAQIVQMNLLAIEDWKCLSKELGRDIELVMRGGLMLAETDVDIDLLTRKLILETNNGLPVRMIEGGELRRMAPYLSTKIRCASFCPSEGHANPRYVTPAFAEAATKVGVTIDLRRRVRTIEGRAEGWRVVAYNTTSPREGDDVVRTEVELVLVAGGAWCRDILKPLGVELTLKPVGLCMSVTERCEEFIGHLVQHVGRRLSVKQVEAGNILIGGGWPATIPGGERLTTDCDSQVLESSMIGNASVALKCIPALGPLNLIRCWTGFASVTPDHIPVLGELRQLPGIFVAAGGSSFTLGLTYARLIGELMCTGGASVPLDMFRPDRFPIAVKA